MKVVVTRPDGKVVEITTEHSASSYGQPVVLVDGQLTDLHNDFSLVDDARLLSRRVEELDVEDL